MWFYNNPAEGGAKNPLGRLMSLYAYLLKNPPKSAKDLQSRTFFDRNGKIPVFNDEQAQRMMYMWIIIHDPAKHRRYFMEAAKDPDIKVIHTQKGGGTDSVIDKIINNTWDKISSAMSGPPNPEVANAMSNISGGFTKVLFALHNVTDEKSSKFAQDWGPAIGFAIDTFDSTEKLAHDIVDLAMKPLAMLLAPIPGSPILVEIIKFVNNLIVAMPYVMTNISMRHFGDAAASYIAAFPGGTSVLGLKNMIDQQFVKIQAKKEKLKNVPVIGSLLTDLHPLMLATGESRFNLENAKKAFSGIGDKIKEGTAGITSSSAFANMQQKFNAGTAGLMDATKGFKPIEKIGIGKHSYKPSLVR